MDSSEFAGTAAAAALATKKLSKSFLVESLINKGAKSAPYDPLMTPYYSNLGNYLYTLGLSSPRFPPTGYLPVATNFGLPQHHHHHGHHFEAVAGYPFATAAAHYAGRPRTPPKISSEKCKPVKPIPTSRLHREAKSVCKAEKSDEKILYISGKWVRLFPRYFLDVGELMWRGWYRVRLSR